MTKKKKVLALSLGVIALVAGAAIASAYITKENITNTNTTVTTSKVTTPKSLGSMTAKNTVNNDTPWKNQKNYNGANRVAAQPVQQQERWAVRQRACWTELFYAV